MLQHYCSNCYAFLDILDIFTLDMSKISSDVLKKVLYMQHDNMPIFPLAVHFITFLLGHAQKSKFQDFVRLFIFL